MAVVKSIVNIVILAILIEALKTYLFSEKLVNEPSKGFAAPGWSGLTEVFDELLLEDNNAGSFAVYYKGELVFHAYGGYADREAIVQYREDTLTQMFSTTKAIGAIVMAKLVEKGVLDYKSPVSKYWPEFAQNGKGDILVEQLLSHQAGLAYLDVPVTYRDMLDDPEKLVESLAAQKPLWEMGTGFGYHALTIGFYEDQLVQRVDPKKRTLSQFFQDEIAKPLDLDIYIGLPFSENYRTARVYKRGLIDFLKAYEFWYIYYDMFMNPDGMLSKSISTTGLGPSFTSNNPWFREVPQPAANGFANAPNLAKLFGVLANGGKYKGKSVLKDKQIKQLQESLVSGVDKSIGVSSNYSRGVMLVATPAGGFAFGTPGAGGQMGFADTEKRLGWAYLTNFHGNYPGFDPRYTALNEAMYKIVKELESKKRQ